MKEFRGELEAGTQLVKASLLLEPVLVTAGEPAGQIHVIEKVSGGGDGF